MQQHGKLHLSMGWWLDGAPEGRWSDNHQLLSVIMTCCLPLESCFWAPDECKSYIHSPFSLSETETMSLKTPKRSVVLKGDNSLQVHFYEHPLSNAGSHVSHCWYKNIDYSALNTPYFNKLFKKKVKLSPTDTLDFTQCRSCWSFLCVCGETPSNVISNKHVILCVLF